MPSTRRKIALRDLAKGCASLLCVLTGLPVAVGAELEDRWSASAILGATYQRAFYSGDTRDDFDGGGVPFQVQLGYRISCFWHHHEGCSSAPVPANNRDWWLRKFADNRRRDQRKTS